MIRKQVKAWEIGWHGCKKKKVIFTGPQGQPARLIEAFCDLGASLLIVLKISNTYGSALQAIA